MTAAWIGYRDPADWTRLSGSRGHRRSPATPCTRAQSACRRRQRRHRDAGWSRPSGAAHSRTRRSSHLRAPVPST